MLHHLGGAARIVGNDGIAIGQQIAQSDNQAALKSQSLQLVGDHAGESRPKNEAVDALLRQSTQPTQFLFEFLV